MSDYFRRIHFAFIWMFKQLRQVYIVAHVSIGVSDYFMSSCFNPKDIFQNDEWFLSTATVVDSNSIDVLCIADGGVVDFEGAPGTGRTAMWCFFAIFATHHILYSYMSMRSVY